MGLAPCRCLDGHVKASDPLYTTGDGRHTFLANLYIKRVIGKAFVMVDLIWMGYLKLQGAKTEELWNEKYLQTAAIELTTPVSQV